MLPSLDVVVPLVLVCVVRPANAVSFLESGYGNNKYCTKTGHFWTHPATTPVKNKLMKIVLEGRTCSAAQVNVVARHGARYTDVGDMRAFTALQEKLKGKFGNQNYAFIDNWFNRYPEEKDSQLTELGEREMFYLGSKYGTELYDLLNGSVSTNGSLISLKFSATRTTRTQVSGDWFFRGLTEIILRHNVTSLHPEIRDNILRFHDNCKRYKVETADLSEQSKFQNGTEFQQMIQEIMNSLMTNVTLSVDDVKTMYRLCATELAIMNSSDWCTIQTDAHREILEYDNDIEDYITRLYGHDVTGQMSCPLGRDIFTNMDNAIHELDTGKDGSYTRGIFQFGHSDTVVDFAAGLGLFKDNDSIRADNFQDMKTRKFHSSVVDPFSSHLVFILYRCDGVGTERYALRLLHNGEPLDIPSCGRDLCWYSDVRRNYRHFIEDCNWDKICEVGSNPSIVG